MSALLLLLLLLLFVDGDDCVLLSLYLVKRPAQHYPVILMLYSKNMSSTLIIITLRCNVYPLALYFYKVKLGLQGNTIFLLCSKTCMFLYLNVQTTFHVHVRTLLLTLSQSRSPNSQNPIGCCNLNILNYKRNPSVLS